MIRAWFLSLAPRERHIVVAGAVVLALVVVYAAVVEPLRAQRAEFERAAAQNRALLAWMDEVGAAIQSGPRRVGDGDSLFALVDRSARSTALAGALQRVQPEGQGTVRVWLDNARFDELVRWLAALEREHGIAVGAMTVDRTQNAGMVNARLTLERG